MKKEYILEKKIYLAVAYAILMVVLLVLIVITRVHPGIFYPLLIAAVVLSSGFGIYWYYRVIQRLKALDRSYQSFGGGKVAYDVFAADVEISRAHDQMMQTFHNMLEQKELVELHRSQAEYLALQNQINPHFLYNTLEGIRSEALIGGLPHVGEMAEVLARFFRYTISNVRVAVTVADEIENVRHYYQIQKFRFGDKIHLRILFEEGEEEVIRKCRIPKLVLQPVVENAIRHGIEPMVEEGTVTIRFQILTERLLIVVSDNGVGMDEQSLLRLNKRLRSIQVEDEPSTDGHGVAMVNVNNRIKLLYGHDYGVLFYSTINLGTDVLISLPLENSAGESGVEE